MNQAVNKMAMVLMAAGVAATGVASSGGAGGPSALIRPDFEPESAWCRPLLNGLTFRLAAWPDPEVSDRMKAIFAADQADRQGQIDWEKVAPRDLARQNEVLQLIRGGKLSSGEDLIGAAFVFQHGACTNHYLLANVLAEQAIRRGHPDARWIYAATYDRWLTSQDKPQKYGTQYQGDASGCHFVLMPYDPATTDAERTKYGVPTLAEAKARAEMFKQPDCPQ